MVELPVDIKMRLDFKQFPLKMQKKKFPHISNKQNTSELCVDVELYRNSNETITNLTQCELFQEESDLLKADLCFSIQPDKIQKSESFTIF